MHAYIHTFIHSLHYIQCQKGTALESPGTVAVFGIWEQNIGTHSGPYRSAEGSRLGVFARGRFEVDSIKVVVDINIRILENI